MKYRLNIVVRLLTATIISYAIATLVSYSLVPVFVLLFNSVKADAVYYAIFAAFIAAFCVSIYSFSAKTLKRLYLNLTLFCVFNLALFYIGGRLL